MFFKSPRNPLANLSRKLPLRVVLIVPFVLQIFGTVGIIGYLSFRSGRETTNDLATQLKAEISDRIVNHLDNYLGIPKLMNRLNADAIARGELSLDLNRPDLDSMKRYLWDQIHQFESVTWISFASQEKGEFIGIVRQANDDKVQLVLANQSNDYHFVYYDTDANGIQTKPAKTSRVYDARTRPWYSIPVQAEKMAWVETYTGANAPILYIGIGQPIYDEDKQLLGVVAIDFALEEINSFLQSLDIGRSGESFIVDRNGNLIATSTKEPPFSSEGDKLEPITPLESDNFLIQATGEYLSETVENLTAIAEPKRLEFSLQGKRQLVTVTPFKDELGLEWSIVVVIPETDFLAQIQANTRNTIILCAIALGIAIAIGILTARWVTQPILHLNRSAKDLARGKWHKIVEVKREDELGELAKSFNSMAVQLQDWFDKLEQRVKERTIELAESNKQLEISKEKADAANQAKSTFLANMSHELRTPLNAILGFSQILTRSQALTREQQENVNIINRSGEYLLTLINNVLNLSKIEAGKTMLNPSDFDLYRLLDEIEQMLYIKAEEKGLQLHFDYAENLPRFIHSDRTKLNQVLINLINNGIKFTREGGISLRVSSHAQAIANHPEFVTLHFEIEDTGVGIAPEEIPQIFEAFGQTQSGAIAKEGTGLGLPISRKFVQLMGGDITVQSTLHRGTIFQFDIQVTLADPQQITTHSARRAIAIASPDPSNYRLLIVDDKSVNRQLLLKLLAPFGFSLKEARNGREARSLWQEWHPHLIWMDLRMPMMDGYEATQAILQSDSREDPSKIIAITASVLEEEKAVVLAAGFADFIRKPFRENDIFQALEKHLEIDFVYEESTPPEESSAFSQISPEDMATLAKIWLRKFQKALIEGGLSEIEQLITEIPPQNKKLADALHARIVRYEFENLLELIEKTHSLD